MKKLILIAFMLIVFRLVSYSQDREIQNDSISLIKTDSLSISVDSQRAATEKIVLPELETTEFITPPSFDSSNSLNFELKPILSSPYYYNSEYLTVFPLSYHLYSGLEGGMLMGVNNHFQLSETFWMDLNVTATSSFVGYLQPDPYNNGSVSLNMKWQVHDRVRLFTYGQLSLREGINPAFSPVINSANYYGGGIEFRITKKIGFGIGFTNSYYRKNWTLNPSFGPVGW
jgi:hypothetical protein